jgi:short-subunit dehydrogenase
LSDALRFEVAGFGVGVTVVQPGIIRTAFGETASSVVPAEQDGPYADFNVQVALTTRSVYERGLLKRLGGSPDRVARAIERALTARVAPVRMRVTPSARLLIAQRRLTPTRLWDAALTRQFPQPHP